MDNLRFFEIYRSSEYLGLLFDGILISAGLTIAAGLLGVALALVLASVRYWQVPIYQLVCCCLCGLYSEHPAHCPIIFYRVRATRGAWLHLAILGSRFTCSDDKLLWLFCRNFSKRFCIHTCWPARGRGSVEPIEENDIPAYRPTADGHYHVPLIK